MDEIIPTGEATVERCARCNVAIESEYYRLAEWKICSVCGERETARPTHSLGEQGRAILFGSGAAFLGFVAYSAVGIATGWNIGYIAVGVAWLVCQAMRKGAPGCGGRKFQVIAALLTYSAVSLSAIPIAIHAWSEQHKSQAESAKPKGVGEPSSIVRTTLLLVGVGLASPFLELKSGSPLNGALGLLLMFFAVRYAWNMMARRELPIHGPFTVEPSTGG